MGPQTVLVLVLTVLAGAAGFARELATAAVYGTSASADALSLTLLYLEGLIVVLMQGASQLLVPLFVSAPGGEPRRDDRVLSSLVLWTSVISLPCLLVSWAAPETVARVLAPGFSADQRAALMPYVGTLVPSCFLITVALMASGVLRARSDFYTPVVGRLLFSLIAALTIVVAGGPWGAMAGAAGFLLGAAAQWGVHWWRLRSLGVRVVRPLWWSPALSALAVGALPVLATPLLTALAVPAAQRAIASDLPVGSFATTNYAWRLLSLASLIILSVQTVAATDLARHLRDVGPDALRVRTARHVNALCFVLAPATILLFVLSRPLVQVSFAHGRFPASAVADASWALWIFSIGLVPWGITAILQLLFSTTGRQYLVLVSALPAVATILISTYTMKTALGAAVLPVASVAGGFVMVVATVTCAAPLLGGSSLRVIAVYLLQLGRRAVLAGVPVALVFLVWRGWRGAYTWLGPENDLGHGAVAAALFLAGFLALSRFDRDAGFESATTALKGAVAAARRPSTGGLFQRSEM